MKKTLTVSFTGFAVLLLAILAWFVILTMKSDAENLSQAQLRELVRKVSIDFSVGTPPETPSDQTLYLSGSSPALGNWNAAGVPLEKKEGGRYHADIQLINNIEYRFKVTRGSWSTVERGAEGAEIPDHTISADQDQTLELDVTTWVDGGKTVPGHITLTGNIHLHKKFHSNLLDNDRDLIVYLPPGYVESNDQRYPVLYMQDGQNLFDEATSFAGIEWNVDEAAQRLITEGQIPPIIIVGIYNAEQQRTEEYTPTPPVLSEEPGGRGMLYGQFVVEEVKPFIDKTYRTQPDRDHTAVAGSSLGGLIALHIAKAHREIFSKCAALTPSLWWGNGQLLSDWQQADNTWMANTQFWVDMGTVGRPIYPGETAIAHVRQLKQIFESAGLAQGTDFECLEVEGGDHTEAAWAARIDQILMFLYGK